jgi:signal transduction histidine kinase
MRAVNPGPDVLIITDEAEFARDLLARWQLEKIQPGLTVMSTELLKELAESAVEVVIVGPLRHGRLPGVLRSLENKGRPIICVVSSAAQLSVLKADHPRVLAFCRHQGWLDTVVLLSGECLRRADLTARLRKAENAALANSRHAALGRYILEARHDFNNSLTSVLGNAELMLMEEGGIPNLMREQLNTIHQMALHMHVVMQRLASLAMEMPGTEKESHPETERASHPSLAAF